MFPKKNKKRKNANIERDKNKIENIQVFSADVIKNQDPVEPSDIIGAKKIVYLKKIPLFRDVKRSTMLKIQSFRLRKCNCSAVGFSQIPW